MTRLQLLNLGLRTLILWNAINEKKIRPQKYWLQQPLNKQHKSNGGTTFGTDQKSNARSGTGTKKQPPVLRPAFVLAKLPTCDIR